jgi:hypothetical protein
MRHILIIAALATAVTSAVTYTPAQARDGAVAAGVVGGLAAGAIIGSAASQRNYYTGPAYVEPSYSPVYGACHTEREQIVDQWGNVRIRRIRVCD